MVRSPVDFFPREHVLEVVPVSISEAILCFFSFVRASAC